MRASAFTLAVAATLLLGCAHAPGNKDACGRSYKMMDMLVTLPMKFWESPPSRAVIRQMFPKGVPEDFVTISPGGSQNDLDVLRLDGCSIAVAVGQGENPDYGSTIDPIGRNLEVLRRNTGGWSDITEQVLPYHLRTNEKAQLHSNGLLVITDASNAPIRLFRFNGIRFAPTDEPLSYAN